MRKHGWNCLCLEGIGCPVDRSAEHWGPVAEASISLVRELRKPRKTAMKRM